MYIDNRIIRTNLQRNERFNTPKPRFKYSILAMILLAALFKPTAAFSGSITSFPSIQTLPQIQRHSNNIHSMKISKTFEKYHDTRHYNFKLHMSEVKSDRESGEEEEFEVTSLKENEEFQAAVTEVKVAAKNVTDSTVALTNTIVKKGPNIIGILLQALVSNELRCVPI